PTPAFRSSAMLRDALRSSSRSDSPSRSNPVVIPTDSSTSSRHLAGVCPACTCAQCGLDCRCVPRCSSLAFLYCRAVLNGSHHECACAVPLVHAHTAMRHPSLSLRSATVKNAPDCVICLPCSLNVIAAGTTTYALSPVMLLCLASPSVTQYSVAPTCSP